jgi:hypothetical protein
MSGFLPRTKPEEEREGAALSQDHGVQLHARQELSMSDNRHLALVVAGLFVLPALAATVQEIRNSMGGRFVVGPDGTPYLVMADGLRVAFADGPE